MDFRSFALIGKILGLIAFVGAIYFSGRLGVEMARNRLPDHISQSANSVSGDSLSVGSSVDPIYLAQSPQALRNFFAAHPTPTSRANADLTGLGVRRLLDSMEIKTLSAEADAVEVMVSSGAIAGAIYWIHYTQLPDPSAFSPIIPPVPEVGSP